jgi:TonB-dependent receptor
VISWSDPNKTIGVSLFGEYSKRKWAAASSTVNDWNITTFANMPGRDNSPDDPLTPIDESADNTVITNAPSNPNQLVAIPNDSRYHYSEFQRERINLAGTVQFRPIENLTITADGLYARNKLREQRSDQTNWFNRPFDHVTFDSDPVVATAIYLDEGSRYTVKDIGFEQQYRATKTNLHSYGLNANWEIAPGLVLNLDGNRSKSATKPDAPNGASSTLVSLGGPVVDAHSVSFTGPIPQQTWVLNDCIKGNCNNVLDLADLGTQVQRTNVSAQSQKVDQYRADLGWNFGDGLHLDVGASHIKSKMRSTQTQTQQQLGDWGITRPGDVQQLAGDLIDQFCLQCKFGHYHPNDAITAFRGNAVDLYNAFAPFYQNLGNPINVTGYNDDTVAERVNSIYAMVSWKGALGAMPASATLGARYESTRVRAHANVVAPTAIVWNADNDFSRVIDFNNPLFVERDGTGKYNNFLPSIDFKIEPVRGLIARASASRTLARPDYGNLFVSEQANAPNRPTYLGGVATGSVGDPSLKPLLSTNLDLSLEYYYGRSNYVSAGFFYKNVKNFIGQAVIDENLFGLRDPSSGAPGTLSGTAVTQLNALSIPISDVSLFTYSALLVKYNGDVAAATNEINQHLTPTGNVEQTYVEQVLAAYDVVPGPNDPLFNFAVTTPINNRTGKIHGFEIQAQHFFGDTGFGVAGSLTKVFGDVNFDRGSPPGTNVFALTGLSDSANATAIFEKYGISARVAYNWRGKFLSSVNNGGSRNPRYFAPYGTLDASLSYDVGYNLAVSVDVQNLTSEPLRVYGRSKRQVFFAQEGHPHFQFGARWRFGGHAAPPPPPMAAPPPPPPATQTCPDGSVIDVTATCAAPPPPPPPPPPPATQGERGQ